MALVFIITAGCSVKNAESWPEPGAASTRPRFDPKSFYGIEAAVKPVQASGEWSNIVLNAIYTMPDIDTDKNHAKFALFFPNGGKIGLCERTREEIECSTLSFPGAGALVRNAFAAVDGFAQQRYRPDQGEFIFDQTGSGYSFKPARGDMAFSVSIIRCLTKK
ncbi:MAG: hypothetical protein LBM00_10130 [Deltaproteobacteria bacterium]|nr:hypothetical protein [Deltaproteobacteria bacterium]